MGKTNSLNSHHPERNTSRADKMSGEMGNPLMKAYWVGKTKKAIKFFANKKRRQFLNNRENDDKI